MLSRRLIGILAFVFSFALSSTTALADAPPVPVLNSPASVTFNSAELSGTVNPGGGPSVTNWFFQFVTKAGKEQAEGEAAEVPWQFANFESFSEEDSAKSEALPVSAPLGGLQPGPAYLIRLGAANEGNEAFSSEAEITTDPVSSPSVSPITVSAVSADSAHIEASVNSGGTGPGEASTYTLECSPQCPTLQGEADGAPISGSGSIEGQTNSGADVAIVLDASGLEPHQSYTVTLRIADAAGLSDEKTGPEPPFQTAAVSPLAETNATHGAVSDTTAQLLGTINPHNTPTTYRFEYGIDTIYGHSVEGGPIAGNLPLNLTGEITGLAPSTEYHFRLVADNGVGGAVNGDDQTFTTASVPSPQDPCPNEAIRQQQGSIALPDCMAYELVSPVSTLGRDVEGGFASPDDDLTQFTSLVPLMPDQQSGNANVFLATRTAAGWSSRDLAEPSPADNRSHRYELAAFATDGSADVLVETCVNLAVACAAGTPYQIERVGADWSREILASTTMNPSGQEGIPLHVLAAAADLSRVVFSNAPDRAPLLTADTHSKGAGLYLSQNGQVSFLGYDQEGHVLDCGAALGAGLSGSVWNNSGFQQPGLSGDGQVAIFTSPDPAVLGAAGCPAVQDVYVRYGDKSFDISAPSNGNPNEGAIFAGASKDGSDVYFTTSSQLLPGDDVGTRDLYRYEVASQTIQGLTNGAEIPTETAGVTSFAKVTVSPRGGYVYFIAANPIEGKGTPGPDGNLFLWHDGAISHIISAGDASGKIALGRSFPDSSGGSSPLTPDGRHLLFASQGQLVGPPSLGRSQIFQYSADDRSLVCISCHPDGASPSTNTALSSAVNVDSRIQSDDGSTVVFETEEPLLPADTNSTTDIYRWQHGALALITNPAEPRQGRGSLFGTTATGRSVFFISAQRLTADAKQDNKKLYAARVNGGFAPVPTPPSPCLADSCRGALAPPPLAASPATPGFAGPGDPKPKHRKHRAKKPKRHGHKHPHSKHPHKRTASQIPGTVR